MQQLEILAYGVIGAPSGVYPQEMAAQLRASPPGADVTVRFHSDGGDAMDGIALANIFRAHGRVIAYIDGIAASAASMAVMGAREVVMAENAVMMLHNPWTIAAGDGDALREHADMIDVLGRAYVAGYVRKSGRSEEEIRAVLARYDWRAGTYLTAEDAVREKLADRIGPPMQAQARADARRAEVIAARPALARMFAGLAPAPAAAPPPAPPTTSRSERMSKTRKEWAADLKAAASDEARAAVLAAMEQDDADDKSDQAQALQARLNQAQAARELAEAAAKDAQAAAEKVTYEAAIRQARADRKITGPAHEEMVRKHYATAAELEKFVATAQAAPELRPERPSAAPGVEMTAHDRRFASSVAKAMGTETNLNDFAARKASVKPPVVRERE